MCAISTESSWAEVTTEAVKAAAPIASTPIRPAPLNRSGSRNRILNAARRASAQTGLMHSPERVMSCKVSDTSVETAEVIGRE